MMYPCILSTDLNDCIGNMERGRRRKPCAAEAQDCSVQIGKEITDSLSHPRASPKKTKYLKQKILISIILLRYRS